MFSTIRDRHVAPVDCDKFGDDEKFVINGLLDESVGIRYTNDFVPGYYQTEFTRELNKVYNRIIFLPIHRDRLVIFTSLLKYFDLNEKKKIVFISTSNVEEIVTYLRNFNRIDIEAITEKNTDVTQVDVQVISLKFIKENQALLSNFSNIDLFVFDDCINDSTINQIASINRDSKILAFTSTLIDDTVNIQDINNVYLYWKQIEMKYNSTISTSIRCVAVQKYVNEMKIRLIGYKFSEPEWNHVTIFMKSILDNLRDMVVELSIENCDEEMEYVEKILEDVMNTMKSHGLYPTFVVVLICQIRIERLKLLCEEGCKRTFFGFLSYVVSCFNVVRMKLAQEMKIATVHNPATIVENTKDKIKALLSLLVRIYVKDYEDSCCIFTCNKITAEMLVFILKKLNSYNLFPINICPEFVDFENYDSNLCNEREKQFRAKRRRNILKKFRKSAINVLVISWDSNYKNSSIMVDRIIYFDTPPSHQDFILSRKYINPLDKSNFLFIEMNESEMNSSITNLKRLNAALREVLEKKDVDYMDDRKFERSIKNNIEISQLYPPLTTKTGKQANLWNSMDFIVNYCESLPTDAFTRPAPRFSLSKGSDGFFGKLELPIQCLVRDPIQCGPIKNKKLVKQVVALEAVRVLYNANELNEELTSTRGDLNENSTVPELLPWIEKNENFSEYNHHIMPTNYPEWLSNCLPRANEICYLHVIQLKPAYNVPEDGRKLFFHNLLISNQEYALLSTKQLPKMCEFPIYNDLGQVNVHIIPNASQITLDEKQIEKVIAFHNFLFLEILQVVKSFLTYDSRDGKNSYRIVPVFSEDGSKWFIAWDAVDKAFKEEIKEPSEEERIRTDYYETDNVGSVVTPWYRTLLQRYYVITKVRSDETPNSNFVSNFPTRESDTFTAYYAEKYDLEVKQPLQPLWEARVITTNVNCVRPRAQNPGARRKLGENEADFEEILIPEFCIVQPFPAVYWYKSVTLLAITHRIHFILNAETLRLRIVNGCSNEPVLYDDESNPVIADSSCINDIEGSVKPVIPIASILKDVKRVKRGRSYLWDEETPPPAYDGNEDSVCLFNMMVYHDFMKSTKKEQRLNAEVTYFDKTLKISKNDKNVSLGPKQRNILQALIVPDCGDVINCKRFSVVGKSFVKFAISLFLYDRDDDINVDQMVQLFQKLTSKQNLYRCSSKLDLGSLLKLQDVSDDWIISGFSVPQLVENVLKQSAVVPEVIFNLYIPPDEQSTGKISSKTRNRINETMINHFNMVSKDENDDRKPKKKVSNKDNPNHALMYLKKQRVSEKTMANAFYAVCGVYLLDCGIRTAFKFLFSREFSSFFDVSETNFENSNYYDTVFDILGYKVTSSNLLREAFVHHSCFVPTNIGCNQRLSFLGDALLDFMFTNYLHEHCKEYSIDEVEDLRLALINDIFYAVTLVRWGLHKYIEIESPFLMEKINQFVLRQNNVNHRMDNVEYLFLIEETSRHDLNSVDVPRILPDTFKAIIAAVFLDCGGDFQIVWDVCTRVFENEIDKRVIDIPRNPIRLLLDTDLKTDFEVVKNLDVDPTFTKIKLVVHIDDAILRFTSVARSKRKAKILAAKMALKNLYKFTL